MRDYFVLTLIVLSISISSFAQHLCFDSSIKESFYQEDVIFVGKVIEVNFDKTISDTAYISEKNKEIFIDENKFTEYKFHVLQSIKMRTKTDIDTIAILSRLTCFDCGDREFNINDIYLVYASYRESTSFFPKKSLTIKRKPFLRSDICNRTNFIEKIKERELRKLKKLVKNIKQKG
ncbi:MAG: hypothetical protein JJE55_04280 [Flavobacteriaceae bacterium]|nr:hypothetical protein [Flavobacteriaceae bacterium]